jgi:hypothetical protein
MARAQIANTLLPGSLRHDSSAVIILAQSGNGVDTMRAYVTATGIALGLLTVWAALVPFVA